MDRDELAAWLRLLETPGVGNETARVLLTRFGLPENIFQQTAAAVREVGGARLASGLTTTKGRTAAGVSNMDALATQDWRVFITTLIVHEDKVIAF